MRRLLPLLILLPMAACARPDPSASKPAPGPDLSALPGGDLSGAASANAGAAIRNPLEGQPQAIADGKRLYVQMNCAGCHGYGLGGSMGPNLKDSYWRYGGTPGAVYRSIAQGHPQGMPAWSNTMPPDEIWRLVAYIQSQGGMIAASDYQSGLQGDYPARGTNPPGGTGAQSGAKGATAPAAQTAIP